MGGTPRLASPKPRESKHFELPSQLRASLLPASELLRTRRLELRERPLATSVAALDRVLGGGLPRGGLVEIVGRGSCGRFAALLAALRTVTGAGEVAALVDQGSQLDPQSAAELGVDLRRLLWLRPRRLDDSLSASELLLHTGFQLVALDLGLPPVRGRAPLAAWLRLSRTAAAHGTMVLVGSPYRLSGCAATAVVVGERSRGEWSRTGHGHLLTGLRARLSLGKRAGHPDLGEAPLELVVPEAAFGPVFEHEPTADHDSEFRTPNSELRISDRREATKCYSRLR